MAEWGESLEALGERPVKRCRYEAALQPSDGKVCVTGASGFLALHVVRELLARGYTVVGTVRSTSNEAKMKPLRAFQEEFGSEKLHIVGGVDCLKAETFDAAVSGCVGVFHTASPFTFSCDDPMTELVEPAKQGTRACLEACQKAGCVKKVIVTSSFAAIFNPGAYPNDYTYSSKDWNKVSRPDAEGNFPNPPKPHGYRYSKIVAEKLAWEFASQESCPFDLACVNPPLIIGHNFNVTAGEADLNESSAAVLKYMTGKTAPGPNSMGFVDVHDVAMAHILVYEKPEASGRRFLCAGAVPTWIEMANKLKELYPACPVNTDMPEGGEGLRLTLDCSDLKELGLEFRTLPTMLKAQGDSLVSQGLVKF